MNSKLSFIAFCAWVAVMTTAILAFASNLVKLAGRLLALGWGG